MYVFSLSSFHKSSALPGEVEAKAWRLREVKVEDRSSIRPRAIALFDAVRSQVSALRVVCTVDSERWGVVNGSRCGASLRCSRSSGVVVLPSAASSGTVSVPSKLQEVSPTFGRPVSVPYVL
jgi:hypothetical protein